MKRNLSFLLLLTVLCGAVTLLAVEDDRDGVPKNVLILDIKLATVKYASYWDTMIFTVINLDTNELVILYYRPNGLDKMVRTGLHIDPDKQKAFLPFSASSVMLPRSEGE